MRENTMTPRAASGARPGPRSVARTGAWAIALLAILAPVAAVAQPASPAPAALTAAVVTGELPRSDPDAPAWSQATPFPVPLVPQDMTAPMVTTTGVAQIDVQALHDGQWIAFRLSWADPTEDRVMATSRFSDAVAVQTPTASGADVSDIAMGQTGRGVEIQLWKAAWQDAAEGRPTTVQTLHPNMWMDRYPEEWAPTRQAAVVASRTLTSRAAGNATQARLQKGASPVQDLASEGFGTLTALEQQRSVGRGAHGAGRWRVVIARPMVPLTRHDPVLVAGRRSAVAFAVWDGAAAQAGARKMRSDWVGLNLGERR